MAKAAVKKNTSSATGSSKKAEKIAKVEKKVAKSSGKYECDVSIAPAQLEKAVTALRKFAHIKADEANMLFDGDAMPIMLLFALSAPPKHQRRIPHMINLPHPIWNDESEVCLITSDPQRKYKDMLEAEPVPAIKKIIGYDKVKKRYNTVVYKRQLARDFELFLCDDNIYSAMPSVTGQKIMKSKPPIPVVLKKGEVQANINKVLNSAHVRVPAGSCIAVRFAKANFSLEEIIANAEVVLKETLAFLKKQGFEVNCVNIQAQDCTIFIFTFHFQNNHQI
jgi:ribosome biogenesis protein UTP30